jgi:thioredoxin reductase (NADPH)
VLAVERYVAVVVRPEACCGLVLCEQRCPNGSLRLGEARSASTIGPALSSTLESTDVPGLFLAGDVTGLPLIKNAILQGARAAEHAAGLLRALARIRSTARASKLVDVCVVGAGPAGISAALRFAELGVTYLVFEQGGVAQSIQSFPRGKLVFDQPLELPVHGKLWLEQATKEELLSAWMRIVRKAKLPIEESTRVTTARRREDGLFEVDTEHEGAPPRRILARSLVLSVGQRGSPRKLDVSIADEAEARVHYHLADARSLAGRRLVIVGLGDVAMEAAIALANQPGTSVTIVHRGATYTRGQSRNVGELERLRKSGRVRLLLGHRVARVDAQTIDVAPISEALPTKGERVPFDHLLVLIGGTRPWALLEALGVRRPEVGSRAGAGVERGSSPTAQRGE